MHREDAQCIASLAMAIPHTITLAASSSLDSHETAGQGRRAISMYNVCVSRAGFHERISTRISDPEASESARA